MAKHVRAQRKNLPPKHLLPTAPRTDALTTLGALPQAAIDMRDGLTPTYLDGIREDNILDGLMGGPYDGRSGGGWTNRTTGHGTFARDKVMQGSYQEAYRISDPELSALYNGNDLAKRVVETVPKEMFRRGWILVVPQEDPIEEGDSPDGGKAALEQPTGGESGPAAPGSPLVDPQGADPANVTAKVPNSQEGDKVAPDMSNAAAQGGDTNPPQDIVPQHQRPLNSSGAAVGGQGDEQRKPGQQSAQVAPAAKGSDVNAPGQMPQQGQQHDPMGEQLAKDPTLPRPPAGAQDTPGGNSGGDRMNPSTNPKTAPKFGAPGASGAPGAKGEGGDAPDTSGPGNDQGKGAKLAIDAEAYAARLSLKARALEACIFGRCYGGGILIVGADDGQDMAMPLDETKIGTIRYLAWVDRRFVFASSWYSEIGPKYGEVRTWQIVNPFGGQANTVVHETRVVRFDGAPVDFLMRRRLLGWTLSVLQAPYDTLRQFDLSFQSISNLMADLSQAVMSINGLAQMISSDQKTLQTRMAMVDMARSSARMLFIDAENEKFERTATPMTGVADTVQVQMLRTAAAAEMPVAILFGREPSGLNATGDADFRRFYDKTAGEQLTDLEPKLRRLYTLIFAAKDGPTHGVVPSKGIEFVWHKLYQPSELEQSTIRWNMAQADDKYIANGTLLPEEVAMSRFRSGDLHLDTEIDTGLREESLAGAALAPSGAAKAEQEAEQAKDLAVTTANAKGSAAGPPGTPGAKSPPFAAKAPSSAKPPPPRGDAWETAERYDSLADDVITQMEDDFPSDALQWMHGVPWRGPVSIPLSQIDFENQDSWKASKPTDAARVQKFVDVLQSGEDLKPAVLVKRPGLTAMIVDGHHRALAHKKAGKKAMLSYIGKVSKKVGPWDETHDAQNDGNSGPGTSG